MESEDKKLTGIKGRFRAPEQNIYGLFLVMVNEELSYIDSALIIASKKESTFDVKISSNCKSFQTAIEKIKYKGNADQNITSQLQNELKTKAMSMEFFDDLQKHLKSNKASSISELFFDIFRSSMHDENIEIVIEMEQVSADEMQPEETDENENPAESSESSESSLSSEASSVSSEVSSESLSDSSSVSLASSPSPESSLSSVSSSDVSLVSVESESVVSSALVSSGLAVSSVVVVLSPV